MRAGPITATVCSIDASARAVAGARAAPRAPRARARSPPPSAKKNCSDGAARLARKETVATCASPVVSSAMRDEC